MNPIRTFARAVLLLALLALVVLVVAWWPAIEEAMSK